MLDTRRGSGKETDTRAISSGPARLSMSLPVELSRQLDVMVRESGLASRSHLIAGLIRDAVAEHDALAEADEMLTATITLVYRGDHCRVRQQIAQAQADYMREVISSQHVFLEDDQSLEAILVQGRAGRLKGLSDALRRLRGVQQLELVVTTSHLPPLHNRQTGMGRVDSAAA